MGFTKAQRLKGLKKQLTNLGYTMTRTGEAPPDTPDDDPQDGDNERGAHTLLAWNAREEAW